jgi:undecaprenyl-diphosphatase
MTLERRSGVAAEGGRHRRRLGRRRWGRTLGTGAAGVVVLFGATLLWGWLAGTSWGASLDRSWAEQFVAHRSASVTGALRWLTWLGDARAVLPLACVLGAFLLWRREFRLAAVLVGSTWGALALSLVGKEMVVRPRPPEATRIVETISSALPSGHAAVAVALLGSLAWAVGRHRHLLVRASAWAGAGVLALAVGCSRVYLGAHWPIDVLSAWTLGAGWLFTCIIASAPGQGSVRHVQAPARLRRVRLEVAPQVTSGCAAGVVTSSTVESRAGGDADLMQPWPERTEAADEHGFGEGPEVVKGRG